MCSDRTNIILATFRNPVPKVIFSSVRENLHDIWKGIDLIIIIIVFPHKKKEETMVEEVNVMVQEIERQCQVIVLMSKLRFIFV